MTISFQGVNPVKLIKTTAKKIKYCTLLIIAKLKRTGNTPKQPFCQPFSLDNVVTLATPQLEAMKNFYETRKSNATLANLGSVVELASNQQKLMKKIVEGKINALRKGNAG